MSVADRLEERKALVLAQSELARLEMQLALDDVRASFAPPPVSPMEAGLSRARRIASLLVLVASPVLGRSRFARLLRGLSVGLAAYRAVRALRHFTR